MDAIDVVNLRDKLNSFSELWSPKIVGEVNDSYIKLVKLEGEFVWHQHDVEDEMFLVLKGRLVMRLRHRDLHVEEGEFVIIPHGVDHLPIAEEEVQVMLIEPRSTLNTGNVTNERTRKNLDRI